MASDYVAIRAQNERRYGTDIGRIGPMLLAERYGDRTHFIFELLQNAEDALARRHGWSGPRSITFELLESALRVSHYGVPFTEADVLGICGIAETTKREFTSLGRFGIGFKSVYAFTDRPEVHSGDESFAIENFVWPLAIPRIDSDRDETVFVLPLRETDSSAASEISAGLQRLGPRVLLFLRQIEEVSWSVGGSSFGQYMRDRVKPISDNAREVVIIGQTHGVEDISEESWLIFAREVHTADGLKAGSVEIAFKLSDDDNGGSLSGEPLQESPLVVFFPTKDQTYLGFLTQGPYRTTPSRDYVPRNDPWNRYLVQETAKLLVESLDALRAMGMLDTNTLRSLPLDISKFGEGSMFAGLFEAVREAFKSKPILPQFSGGHVTAAGAKLARTQDLRELLSPSQLTALLQAEQEVNWLSEEITQDRTPELRQYLMHELDIPELTPETIIPRLTRSFLEDQTDAWIVQLYEFLNGQSALLRSGRFTDVPLVRLEDGSHITARKDGHPQAFLPGPIATGFPTVRRTVCGTEGAKKLLQDLGLTEPDPVDDVIRNVLPRYRNQQPTVSPADYAADVMRLLNAFRTDSKSRREALESALRDYPFLAAVDAGTGARCFARPIEVYIATERLTALFEGVPSVLLVDDSHNCLRGEEVRGLLEACGATRYLQPIPVEPQLSGEERRDMRREAGCEDCRYELGIEDFSLRGIDDLLEKLRTFAPEVAAEKAELLWKALSDVEDRRVTRAFSGTYRWFFTRDRSCSFPSMAVRRLNSMPWVPDRNGTLQQPGSVIFQDIGWEENPFLLSKIRFKPPIIETLAKEAGIELGVLDLLKKLGVTSEAELRARLGMENEPETHSAPGVNDVNDAVEKLLGDSLQPTPPVRDPASPEPTGLGAGQEGTGTRGETTSGGRGGTRENTINGDWTGAATQRTGMGKSMPGRSNGRPFTSYVGTHLDDEEPDPDGVDQEARMALEEKAIDLILTGEPHLKRTPMHNPGYDLFEAGEDGQPVRWIEVKAMTGDLYDRPVGVSRTQFQCAQQHGEAYWLYVVENAGDENRARIVRIQDPAGKARTFTFDHGWLAVAELVEGGTALVEEEASS